MNQETEYQKKSREVSFNLRQNNSVGLALKLMHEWTIKNPPPEVIALVEAGNNLIRLQHVEYTPENFIWIREEMEKLGTALKAFNARKGEGNE